MRIAAVTPAFHPATHYGGPIASTLGLLQGLARLGCQVRVLTTNANGPSVLAVDTAREVELEPGLSVTYLPRLLPDAVAPALLPEVVRLVRWSQAVHLTGVYSFTTPFGLSVARTFDRPLVWSLRGSLQRWERTRSQKLKALWERACRLALPRRTLLHVTSEDEERESKLRMPGVPALVLPNGVELPPRPPQKTESAELRLVFMGRLDPIKGIENLLEACAAMGPELPFSLELAGRGTAEYEASLESRSSALGLGGRVRFLGDVRGPAKSELFARADLLVLPSHVENFGMVVLEALAHATPVIASRGTPWRALEDARVGLWVDNSPDSLREAIARCRQLPLREMGERGRRWVEESYAWPAIARHMLEAMTELQGSARPL